MTRASLFDGFEPFAAQHGLDFTSLITGAGLEQSVFSDLSNDISLNAAACILNAAAERSGNACFGLDWAEQYPKGASGVLGYVLLNARNVRSALKNVARYATLFIEPIDLKFEESDGFGHFTWRFPVTFTEPRMQFASFAMAIMIRRLRHAAGATWSPMGVDLEHRELPCRDKWLRAFGPNVRFDCPVNALHIREAVLDRSAPDADKRLFELIRELGDRMLAERGPKADAADETRRAILQLLDDGDVSLDTCAEVMGIAPRTLQSRLAALDTTYETLLQETRQAIAESYLRNTDLPLTDIALLLGFSELSAFTRAAQRWFGKPPSLYRQELRRGSILNTA